MPFIPRGTLNPHGAPVLRSHILANSATFTVFDSVRANTSGFIGLGTAGASVLGHIVALRTNQGVGLLTTGAAGAEIGSFINTFTTASNNQTVARVRAEIDVSKSSLYAGELSAAIGTTTGSNLLGYYLDLTDEDTLNEGSAATTAAQYFNHGVDTVDSTSCLVNVFESQVFGV